MPNMGVTLAGIRSNLGQYAFTVDVPSLDPSNSAGSTGSISFDTGPLKRAPQYRNNPFTLTDSRFGSICGRISEVSFGSGAVNFTAETVFQRLTATSTVPPKFGASTLACMNAVLAIGGFTCDGLDNANTDEFPGWYGSILQYLQLFCSARNLEYVVDNETLHFRATRETVYTDSLKDLSYTLNDQTLAKNVDVVEYAYTHGDNIEFFPIAAQDVAQVLTVDTTGTIVYEVKVNGWMDSVNQPTQEELVGPTTQDGTTGSYCVSGNDGLPLTTSHWDDLGGRVKVEVTDDPSILRITIWGPSAAYLTDGVDTLSPYSIAASAGDGVYYNSLHVTGKGIRYNPTTHRLPSGAVSRTTIDAVGATVENPFLNTPSRAYDAGLRAAQTYAGPTYTVAGSTAVVQDYKNVLGAKLYTGVGSTFRVTSATVTQSGEALSGVMDTTFADFNDTWAGKTFGDFSSIWGEYTFLQFNSHWDEKTFGDFNTIWAGKTFGEYNAKSGYQTFGSFAPMPLLLDLSVES